jgi:hypothetical protein
VAHYTIWFDAEKEGGKYTVVDTSTRKPFVGKDGKPLTDLSFKQAVELIEKLELEQKSRDR